MTQTDTTATQATCPATPGALDSTTAGAVLALTYALAVCVPAIAVAIEESGEGMLSALGKAAGVAGLSILLLQPLLAGRIRPFSRPFGYDRVILFHKTMALVALALIAAHPVLIAAGYQYWALLGLDTGWTVWLGKVALILLLGVVVAPLAHVLLGLDYQVWRVAHKSAIVVALLGAAHMGFMTHDPGLRLWFAFLLVAGGGVFLWRNAVLPFAGRRRLRVKRVARETRDAWTLELEPDKGKPLFQMPGQFVFLKLCRKGRRSEEHPFTIASAPGHGDCIRLTVKESGGYTRTIGQTRAGDTARLEGPFGRFSCLLHRPERILFIAGGVGITPVMSMIRYLRHTSDAPPATLIYGNKTENDILFRDELDALPENFTVVHVLSEPDEKWRGPRGFVDASCVEKFVPESVRDTAHTYVCGPPAMMRKTIAALRGLGVPRRRIHYEKFGL